MNGAGFSQAFHQALRWRLRGVLRLVPKRPFQNGTTPREVAYLFAGTYGDFVQALRPLQKLAEAFPQSRILVFGADRLVREFARELPAGILPVTGSAAWRWLWRPVDLMFTNAVGVYRVRFDLMAVGCARRAYGFRHARETRRGGYQLTLPLNESVRSFAAENLRLLEVAGVVKPGAVEDAAPKGVSPDGKDSLGLQSGPILFHLGSVGLKKDFGLKIYTRIIFGILNKLDGRDVRVIMGPGDEDIALEVATGTRHVPQMYPMARLVPELKSFSGSVLCFNSFLAHLCVYLERPAIVMHREAVPFGYDCTPWHRQVILRSACGWDASEVLALLASGPSRRDEKPQR